MRIIPNLFLQGNRVVSLYKGTDNELKKTYPKAAKTYAAQFRQQKAEALFVVDLNGSQREHLPELKAAFKGELWWGGQVRDLESIRWLLANGAQKVVLGQAAEAIFLEALKEFGPEKLMVGLQVFRFDDAPSACEQYAKMGFTDLIVKDMMAEGTLFHPDFDLIEKCVYFSKAKIYASGGISEASHIKLLKEAGASGVLIGRALYERRLNIEGLKAHL